MVQDVKRAKSLPRTRKEEDPNLRQKDTQEGQRRAKEQAEKEAQRRNELMAEARQKEEEAMLKMIEDQRQLQEELAKRRTELELKAKQDLIRVKQQKLAALASAASNAATSTKRSKSASERTKITDPCAAIDSEISTTRSDRTLSRSTASREPDPRPIITAAVLGGTESRRRLLANLLFVAGAWDRTSLEHFQTKEAERRNTGAVRKANVMRPPAFVFRSGRLAFLEMPSLQDDLGSALASMAHVDVALLVVSAVNGLEEGMLAAGSSEIWEQAVLIRASGVQNIIVAVDGMEDPKVSWRQDDFDAVRVKLNSLLNRLGLLEASFVPISNMTRGFLTDRHVEGTWFTGHTIVELLAKCLRDKADSIGSLNRLATAESAPPCFLPIEASSSSSSSSSATCKLEGFVQSGVVRPGWSCRVLPSGQDCTIQEIISADGFSLTRAPLGERVVLRLEGPQLSRVVLGEVLCCGIGVKPVHEVKVALQILDTAGEFQIASGFRATFCAFGAQSPCELLAIYESIDLQTRTKLNSPHIVGTHSLTICSVKLDRSLMLGAYAESNALGRFVLRTSATLIGVGWVVALACSEQNAVACSGHEPS